MTAGSDRARDEAREILAERRFHETELPRPLRRPLEWLGDRLEPLLDALDDLLPGGDNVVWAVLAALVLLVAFALAARLVGARAPSGVRRGGGTGGDGPVVDAAEFERRADEAERAGDLERALRLRFRAGVLRLAERHVLDDPVSVTSGELVRRLRSEAFAQAAASFDEVVYGRRSPTVDDVRLAREGWRAALAGGRS